ncbi:uncharacterized protein LOC119366887 [Triticum dicoccoides]|uniref:Dirigent protein n=1 Tax=Triticum turgidum subsp. durum TaxID=4567 RepID=A0A9R1RGJ2_TRITD|nr:uncharacterized protein LOC119366887 [Triticum dicoccoides]VAH40567.1 unnamed protein product [Triticum turgidum subsp. durum]
MAKYLQSAPVSQGALQHKEFLLDGLYMEQRPQGSPNPNEVIIVNPGLPMKFGCTAATDWTIYDGIGPDKKLVAHAQGVLTGAGATEGTWSLCFNMVFVDERFKGSSLKVLGNMSSPLEGEWAILGGTGEFAYAQGVVLFKIQKFYELQIRVLCLNFSSSLSLPIKMGPWGGNGGFPQDMTAGKPLRLRSMRINSGSRIFSLEFSYVDKLGKVRSEGPWGGSSGGNYQTIELGPKEFVKQISGTIDNLVTETVITSLVLVTNIRKYGPYGSVQGTSFDATVPENTCVVGFFGRSGGALDAIGIYHGPIAV